MGSRGERGSGLLGNEFGKARLGKSKGSPKHGQAIFCLLLKQVPLTGCQDGYV